MKPDFPILILLFTTYSVIGWVCESVYCSVAAKKAINRGFLSGPWCPVYGLGALLILTVNEPLPKNPFLVFLASMAAATILEYVTGWLMEKTFHTTWWDYSGKRFQLHGRICLKNSLLFSLLGVAVSFVVHPRIDHLIRLIPGPWRRTLAGFLMFLLLVDLLASLNTIFRFTERLRHLQELLQELEQYETEYDWFDRRDIESSIARLRAICSQDADNTRAAEILARLDRIAGKHSGSRMMHAFPRMKPKGLTQALESLRESREHRQESLKEKAKKLPRHIGGKTASATKQAAHSVADNTVHTGLYRLVWVFISAGVIGYILETIFCLITIGTVESRQGMLYGPFNQVYAFGAVIMVLLLSPLARKNDRWLFVGGMITGGAFEFFCSWLQEKVFGTVSWEYSEQRFSIGGRTSLTFMFFWGVLAVFFIKVIWPRLNRMISRIPKKQGTVLCSVIMALLAVNTVLSVGAVSRWTERTAGQPSQSSWEVWLDERYPDDFMEEVYPNMTILMSQAGQHDLR